MSLYESLVEAGIETDSHESDLYFPATPEALAILDLYPKWKRNAERFVNQAPPHIGQSWVDVPFAFGPFWKKKAEVAARAERMGTR